MLSAGLLLAAAPAYSQQPGMTARDMFESAAGLLVPAPAAKAPAAKTAKTPKTKVAKSTPAQGANPATSPSVEQAKSGMPAGQADVSAGAATTITAGQATVGSATVVPVSLESGKTPQLGLRYSILRQVSGSQTEEVDADAPFRSGERIRVSVQANDTAHLYIVLRGTSGNWTVLFPSPEISGGNNVIERGKQYEIPSGHWFTFDQQAGEEKLFIVLSRKPEADLEKMIYSLRQGQDTPPPAAAPRPDATTTIMAENRPPIGDDLVSRVRSQVFARDLVFEKVDENTPGEKKEKAVYVVNKTGSADSRVVADLKLSHK